MNNSSTHLKVLNFQLSLSVIETCISSTLYAIIASSGPVNYYIIFEGVPCCGNKSLKFARVLTVS